MKRMTEAAGRALLKQFHKSGLRPSRFCEQQNIRYHILSYWRARLSEIDQRSQKNQGDTQSTAFVQMVTQSPSTSDTFETKKSTQEDEPVALDQDSAAAVIMFPNKIRMAIGRASLSTELIEALARC